MKKIDLAQTLNTLANVGVIAGIIFLAFELRQNNDLLTAQARVKRPNDRRPIAVNTDNRPSVRWYISQDRVGH